MITTNHTLHFQTGRRTKKQIAIGVAKPASVHPRIPRVSKIMALAIRMDQLIRDGDVKDQAELARLGHVTRARLTQIMKLLQLAPDIQEELLFLNSCTIGKPILERELRRVAKIQSWKNQREIWQVVVSACR